MVGDHRTEFEDNGILLVALLGLAEHAAAFVCLHNVIHVERLRQALDVSAGAGLEGSLHAERHLVVLAVVLWRRWDGCLLCLVAHLGGPLLGTRTVPL